MRHESKKDLSGMEWTKDRCGALICSTKRWTGRSPNKTDDRYGNKRLPIHETGLIDRILVAIRRMAISTNPSESDLAGIIHTESDLEFLGKKLSKIDGRYIRVATALYPIVCNHPFYEGDKS